jgi:hypothetical protein
MIDPIEAKINSIYISLPGIIKKIDNNFCDVQPLYNQQYVNEQGEINSETLPIISNVPLLVMGTQEYFINVPSKVGDIVTLMFTNKDLFSYYQSDGTKAFNPTLLGSDLNNCYALPFFLHKENNVPHHNDTFSVEKRDGSFQIYMGKDNQLQVKADSVKLGSLTADKALALAQDVKDKLDGLMNNLNTHVHTCSAPASPSSPSVTPLVQTNTVASTKVFSNG